MCFHVAIEFATLNEKDAITTSFAPDNMRELHADDESELLTLIENAQTVGKAINPDFVPMVFLESAIGSLHIFSATFLWRGGKGIDFCDYQWANKTYAGVFYRYDEVGIEGWYCVHPKPEEEERTKKALKHTVQALAYDARHMYDYECA